MAKIRLLHFFIKWDLMCPMGLNVHIELHVTACKRCTLQAFQALVSDYACIKSCNKVI